MWKWTEVYSCSAWEIASDMKWKEICGSVETKRKVKRKEKQWNFVKGKKCHFFALSSEKKHTYRFSLIKNRFLLIKASFATYFYYILLKYNVYFSYSIVSNH